MIVIWCLKLQYVDKNITGKFPGSPFGSAAGPRTLAAAVQLVCGSAGTRMRPSHDHSDWPWNSGIISKLRNVTVHILLSSPGVTVSHWFVGILVKAQSVTEFSAMSPFPWCLDNWVIILNSTFPNYAMNIEVHIFQFFMEYWAIL